MHLIVCMDDRDGVSFCGKRLSSDKNVTEHILQLTAGSCLWMNSYSQKLFADGAVSADENFLEKAGEDDYCFLEITPLPQTLPGLQSVILYHWNRSYPSTQKFPRTLLDGFRLVHTEDFPGNSHENITMERYTL